MVRLRPLLQIAVMLCCTNAFCADMLQEVSFFAYNVGPQLTGKDILKPDTAGELVLDSYTSYTYESGLLKSAKRYNSGDVLTYVAIYGYNADGELDYEGLYLNDSGVAVLQQYIIYTYNTDTAEQVDWSPVLSVAQKQIVSSAVCDTSDIVQSYCLYEYDTEGRLSFVDVYDPGADNAIGGSDDILTAAWIYVYDSAGKMTSLGCYDGQTGDLDTYYVLTAAEDGTTSKAVLYQAEETSAATDTSDTSAVTSSSGGGGGCFLRSVLDNAGLCE